MNLEDALCLFTISGLKDPRLREKLSELENPTMPAFSVLIDAHMHAKATAGGSAAAAAASAASTNKGQGKKKNSNNNNNNGRPPLSDTEKKRRSIMKGKCYRCRSPEHMANACNVAKEVKCKKCNATGHTAAACVSGQARATDERKNQNQNSTLALEYLQSSEVAHSNALFGVALTGVGEGSEGHHSCPTPPLLL